MKQLNKVHRSYAIAVSLGLAACVTNVLSFNIEPRYLITIGDLFVFIAAGALGATGAAIAVLVAKLPCALIDAQYVDLVRTAVIAVMWGYLSTRNSRYAGFPATAALWLLVFTPAIAIGDTFGFWSTNFNTSSFARLAFTDIFFSLTAGAILLNQNIWVSLAQRPRRFSLSRLLLHVVTLISVFSMSLAFMMPQIGLAILSQGRTPVSFTALAFAFAAAIAVPAFISVRLSDMITKWTGESFSSNLLQTSRELTFSGLSSPFWRRKNSYDSSDTLGSPSGSETRLIAPGTGGRQINPDLGICAIDNIGTITFVNRRFLKLLEVKDREVAGKKIDSLPMPQVLHDEILRLVTETQKQGPQVNEVKINRLPDNLRFFEVRTERADSLEDSTLADTNGGIIITVKDITERRAIETHLLQAQRLASLGNFVAGIGHAFNNALTAILGRVAFAQASKDPETREQALLAIADASKKAGEQVKLLIDFAEGKPSLFQETDLAALMTNRMPLIQGLVGDRVEIEYSAAKPEVGIQCDANLILQAVTNLMLNARDSYKDSGGKIQISVDTETIPEQVSALHVGARPGTFARLRIRDNGAGMTQDILARAFDPLFTTKKGQGRTGLGLSTVFAIVRAHDGFLTAESHPNKGTSISIYLPLADFAKKEVGVSHHKIQERPLAHSLPTGSGKILVVEDEGQIRDLVSQMLGLLGYEVKSCASGDEALVEYRKKSFDLVLVDMAMPRMDGAQLIEEIRAINQNARTLLMSGYGSSIKTEEPLLAKPFDLETLAKTVKEAITT